jgi:hypothetical protein
MSDDCLVLFAIDKMSYSLSTPTAYIGVVQLVQTNTLLVNLLDDI